MGIAYSFITRMDELGLFRSGGMSILDIGSSNLYSATAGDIVGFLNKYAPALPDRDAFAQRLAAGSGYDPVRGGLNESVVGELFEKAGMEYVSFDIAAGYKTTILDLNHARLPAPLRGRFDLVLNFGTTEHILNQYNCFKVIHDATRVGGCIYHSIPAIGYVDHGYITYTPRCLFDIAGYNEYEVVDFWFEGPSGRNNVYDGVRSYRTYFPVLDRALAEIGRTAHGTALNDLAIPDVSISIVCRKVKDKPFWGALESSTSVGEIPDSVTASYTGREVAVDAAAAPASDPPPAVPLKHRVGRALSRFPMAHSLARRAYRWWNAP